MQFISAEYRKEAITLLCVGFKIEKTYQIIRKTNDIILISEDGTNLRKLYLNDVISQAQRISINSVELSPQKVFEKYTSKFHN